MTLTYTQAPAHIPHWIAGQPHAGSGERSAEVFDPALGAVALPVTLMMAERNSRFSSEEEALRSSFMGEMTRAGARHLMDQGNWITGRAGEVLINAIDPEQEHKVSIIDNFMREGDLASLAPGEFAMIIDYADAKAQNQRGGRLVVFIGDNANVGQVLESAGVDTLIPVFTDMAEGQRAALA